ncbi:hypothetical protein E2C01_056927 [Portunus trituberculatus]|uniref:Uncharacterized protein n=1 Tax=Portunus trituberculatus TaxID=210409 RepID=A0A5B7GZ14_PORTR|nr:hypothetical protein [Portunus trituberculatus]
MLCLPASRGGRAEEQPTTCEHAGNIAFVSLIESCENREERDGREGE